MNTAAENDETGWHRFLTLLDPEPRQAAARYSALRTRLVESFKRRNLRGDDLADEAIERAVRRIASGDPVQHVLAFVHGVARRVALEEARRAGRRVPLEDDGVEAPPRDEDEVATARLATLERCLRAMPAQTREQILRYHADARDREQHTQLASELGTGLNALRIRMHRMRRTLRAAIEAGGERRTA